MQRLGVRGSMSGLARNKVWEKPWAFEDAVSLLLVGGVGLSTGVDFFRVPGILRSTLSRSSCERGMEQDKVSGLYLGRAPCRASVELRVEL